MKESADRARFRYFIIFLVLSAVIILIALYADDDFVRPYLGDAAAAAAVFFLACAAFKKTPKLLVLYVFIFTVIVELMQFFNVLALVGLSENRALSVIAGSTFDFADILCYAAGCLSAELLRRLILRTKK